MVFFLKRHYKPHNNHSKHIQQNNSTKEGFVTRTDEDAALCCFGEKQKKKRKIWNENYSWIRKKAQGNMLIKKWSVLHFWLFKILYDQKKIVNA